MARFVIIFLLVLVSLFTIEMQIPVQQKLIEPFTGLLAALSAGLILPFDDSVRAFGKILQFGDTGFAGADDELTPMTEHPDNIKVLVVGGPGKHSSVIPSWGMTKSVTIAVDDAEGA